MTDKELLRALKCCGSDGYNCGVCPCFNECEADCGNRAPALAAVRLEELLAENERLKAGKDRNVPTKWISVEERLPESNDKQVLAVVNGIYGGTHFYDAIEIAEFVLDEGWILESYPEWENPNVTYWANLPELPSTEGVE